MSGRRGKVARNFLVSIVHPATEPESKRDELFKNYADPACGKAERGQIDPRRDPQQGVTNQRRALGARLAARARSYVFLRHATTALSTLPLHGRKFCSLVRPDRQLQVCGRSIACCRSPASSKPSSIATIRKPEKGTCAESHRGARHGADRMEMDLHEVPQLLLAGDRPEVID
jgi:hypothetical protein